MFDLDEEVGRVPWLAGAFPAAAPAAIGRSIRNSWQALPPVLSLSDVARAGSWLLGTSPAGLDLSIRP